MAPRLSGAYSINNKTTIRGGVGRSFGRVTVISGTSHFAGFIGQYEFLNGDNGVTPTFLLDQGMPSYPLPPQINPSFSNNLAVDYWNGDAAMTPATYDTWTISMQREVRRGMTVEVDYNGSKGTNLQANLLNINQVPLSAVNDLIARLGTDAGGRAAEHAGELGRGRCGGDQDSVRELHESGDPDDAKRRAGAASVSAVRHRSTRPTAAATRPAGRCITPAW